MSFISQIFGSPSVTGVQNNTRNTQENNAALQKGSEYLKDMPGGSVVEGKITDIKGRDVQIELPEGGRVNAQLESAMNLSEGATLAFEIRQNSSNQISLTPLYTNLAMGQTATNALNMAGMDVNQATVSMTMSMMEGGMNVDSKALGDMYHLISRYPDADVSNIVEMKRLDLPVNEQTVAQYEAFKNYEGQIQAGFEDIASNAVSLYDEMLAGGETSEAVRFIADLTEIIGRDASLTENTPEAKAQDISESNGEKTVLTEGAAVKLQALKEELYAILEKPAEAETVDKEGTLVKQTVNAKADAAIVTGEKGDIPKETKTDEAVRLLEKADGEKAPAASKGTDQAAAKNIAQDSTAVVKDTLVKILEDHGAKPALINEIRNTPEDARTIISLMHEAADKLSKNEIKDPALKMSLEELIKSSDFKETVKTAMKDNWVLKPEQVADKGNVEQLYQRLGEQTKDMLQLLNQIARPESAMAAKLSDMGNNLDFMNQMNQAMQYVQLPLKMNGSDNTGDLYVYSDKRSLANKDGNVSAFLHLDMTNLGTVDVYAAISQGNKVSTKFYLESDEMIDFIAENIHILDERLQNRGYSINSEIKKHSDADEKSKTVRSLTDTEKPVPIYTSSFDLRA